MKMVDRVSRLLPWVNKAVPAANGHQMKGVGSGVTFVGAPDWTNILRLDSTASPDAEELTRSIALATSTYAYTAIMYRATRIAEPPLRIVEATEDGDVEVEDHELAMLLEEPSPDYDMGELQQLTEIYRLITGSCLWVKEVDLSDRPARWVPFSGDEFESLSANGRIYGAFRVTTSSGQRVYPADQVCHFRDLNPSSWRKGLPKLDVALATLDLGHQVNRTVRNFMRKAMFPGGVISPDAAWNPDDEQWEEWKDHILAWHQGPANAGDPLVLQGGTQFTKAASGLQDLLPTEVLDRVEACIGAVFGTPPVVLGWKVGIENSPWSNMPDARQMTYEDTVEPRWRDVEKKMTRQLLSREDRDAGRRIVFDVSNVRAFQADDPTRAGVANTMKDTWTLNERRAYTGKDPLPEDDPRGEEIGGGAGAANPFTELSEGISGLSAGMELVLAAGEKGLANTKVFEWVAFDIGTKAAEASWERVIAKALKDIQDGILRLADKHLEEKAANPDSVIAFIASVGTWLTDVARPLLGKATLPLIISTGRTGVRRAAAQTGLSFSVLEPGLLAYAAEEADFLASVMSETTGRRLAQVVQGQLNEGALITDIRKAVQEMPGFSRQRAQLVARTETTRAWNGAQRRAMSDWQDGQPEGVKATKEWLTAQDDRVRDEHADLDGDVIGINETFGSTGLTEPSEPNCRCTLVYGIEAPDAQAAANVQRPTGVNVV